MRGYLVEWYLWKVWHWCVYIIRGGILVGIVSNFLPALSAFVVLAPVCSCVVVYHIAINATSLFHIADCLCSSSSESRSFEEAINQSILPKFG